MKATVNFLVLKERYICPECGAELQPQLITGVVDSQAWGLFGHMKFFHEYRAACERSGHKFDIAIGVKKGTVV